MEEKSHFDRSGSASFSIETSKIVHVDALLVADGCLKFVVMIEMK